MTLTKLPTNSECNHDERRELESLVDRRGIQEVLVALSELCSAKADHILATWQDEPLAAAWLDLATALDTAVAQARGL